MAVLTHETFIKKKAEKKIGFNVASLFRNAPKAGDIGIEIEVEGNAFPKTRQQNPQGVDVSPELIPPQWAYHHDGSLRGADNAEYVFKKPLKFGEVPKAVNDLWAMFEAFGSKLDASNRTSVHVHLNAQKWHLNRIAAFAALYLSVEELLTEWCGDHRVGNLFCLRAKDAPAIVTKLKEFLKNDGKTSITEGLHYAGLNIHALTKFGSIEIRALRGCTDAQTVLDWVGMLERIYHLSGEFKDPRGVCDNFSGEGPMAYLDMVLGDKVQVLKEGISYDPQQIMGSLYEGIRLAQDICYCRDWSEYEPVDTKPDPFQRDIVQASATLQQSLQQYMDHLMSPNPVLAAGAGAWPIPSIPGSAEGEEYDPDTDFWVEDYDAEEE